MTLFLIYWVIENTGIERAMMMFWVLLKASTNACVVVFCLLEGGEEGATRLPHGALGKVQ
jgi:hypothetical protein